MVHLAFVSAPGGSLFMEELLAEVAATVNAVGGSASCHRGSVSEVVGDDCVAVIVPHEYVALTTPPTTAELARTIGFGVEHPGTQSFENSALVIGQLAACFEISAASTAEMRRRGVNCERFVLGYNRTWATPGSRQPRDIDVIHLGTADKNRLEALAPIAADLSGLRTRLMLPPHEWMSVERPDFVVGEGKRRLLRRSRVLLNLHREDSTAFEWVRAFDAIRNGCVVLTEPSTGLHPLVPGEHLLVARREAMAGVARAALAAGDQVDAIAEAAFAFCRDELNMEPSAARLADIAVEVAASARSAAPLPPRQRSGTPHFYAMVGESPMALWVPCERALPTADTPSDLRAAELFREVVALRRGLPRPAVSVARPAALAAAEVDVLCVRRHGDGPVTTTVTSLDTLDLAVAVHLGCDGDGGEAVAAGDAQVEFVSPVGRAVVRNTLLAAGTAPYVLVLDSGDEVLGRAVADAVQVLREHPEVDIAYPMAVLGSEMIVNVLIPELRRLRDFPYLGRGFLVRRTFLQQLGGFAEDPELEDFTDHEFWVRAMRAGAQATLIPQVGVRLWQQQPAMALHDLDPAATSDRARKATMPVLAPPQPQPTG